jgi:hypothetical protein
MGLDLRVHCNKVCLVPYVWYGAQKLKTIELLFTNTQHKRCVLHIYSLIVEIVEILILKLLNVVVF